jgi:hypothetical protein
MWLVYLIISMVAISITQAVNKEFGFCLISYMVYSITCVSLLGWMLPLCYQLSLTFYKPYFLGVALLSIFGLLISAFYFKEVILWYNYIGIVLSLIGALLMVKI